MDTAENVIERTVSDGRVARVVIVDGRSVAYVGDVAVGNHRPAKLPKAIKTASGTVYTHVIGALALTTAEAELITAALSAPKPLSRRRFSLGTDGYGEYEGAH